MKTNLNDGADLRYIIKYGTLILFQLLIFSCSEVLNEWVEPAIEGSPYKKKWGFHQIQNGKETFSAGIEEQLSQLGGNASFVATFTDPFDCNHCENKNE